MFPSPLVGEGLVLPELLVLTSPSWGWGVTFKRPNGTANSSVTTHCRMREVEAEPDFSH